MTDRLARVRQVLDAESSRFVFACGGRIPISTGNLADLEDEFESATLSTGEGDNASDVGSTAESQASEASLMSIPSASVTSAPVVIRWDPDAHESALASDCKVTLPLSPEESDVANRNNLDRLLATMQPASFGKGGQDVYDESYRRASKLDPSRFSSTFNPYELGIIDAAAQVLLPSPSTSSSSSEDRALRRGLRAELYMLNAYSGPSGHFHAHVDTPRSVDQVGSLVVCLPAAHEGGQLEVRHHGEHMAFDWGVSAESSIQWAAFYSDCEHEVMEVTSGHRLTLTYNLYATRGAGLLAGQQLDMGVQLHKMPFSRAIAEFLDDEKFFEKGGLIGIYCAHAYPYTAKHACLPASLKGIDMIVWDLLVALGCKLSLNPVIGRDELKEWSTERYDQPPRVGESLEFTEGMFENDDLEVFKHELKDNFQKGAPDHDKIQWLNNSNSELRQKQYATIAYGNQAQLDIIYSTCAIVAKVPRHSRMRGQVQNFLGKI